MQCLKPKWFFLQQTKRKLVVYTKLKVMAISYNSYEVAKKLFLDIRQRILKKCITVSTKYYAAQLFSTFMMMMMMIIWNISWAANQDFRMISEGSCDNEDWSKFSGITVINYIFK